jgi:hypothetical protein
MALATIPPAIEIRETQPVTTQHVVSDLYWTACSLRDNYRFAPWKTAAFSGIAALEQGKNVPGLGDFRVSDQTARELRLRINEIAVDSLPIPTVVPLSGRGIMLSWESGARTVEITAFADGEIVVEAIGEHAPEAELTELETLLKWLIKTPEIQHAHATAR